MSTGSPDSPASLGGDAPGGGDASSEIAAFLQRHGVGTPPAVANAPAADMPAAAPSPDEAISPEPGEAAAGYADGDADELAAAGFGPAPVQAASAHRIELGPFLRPLIAFLGLGGLFAWAQIYQPGNQTVSLVNGLDWPYTFSLDGQEYAFTEGHQRLQVTLGQGEHTLALSGSGLPAAWEAEQTIDLAPLSRIALLSRDHHVINPDGCALLAIETGWYGHEEELDGREDTRRLLPAGLTHNPDGVFLAFESWPDEIEISHGNDVESRDRLIVHPTREIPPQLWLACAARLLPQDDAEAWVVRRVVSEAGTPEALLALDTLPLARQREAIAHRIDEHPPRVDWHERWIDAGGQSPGDLATRYAAAIAAHPDDPAYAYLAARSQPVDDRVRALRRVARTFPDYVPPHRALAEMALASGRFKDAGRSLALAKKAAAKKAAAREDEATDATDAVADQTELERDRLARLRRDLFRAMKRSDLAYKELNRVPRSAFEHAMSMHELITSYGVSAGIPRAWALYDDYEEVPYGRSFYELQWNILRSLAYLEGDVDSYSRNLGQIDRSRVTPAPARERFERQTLAARLRDAIVLRRLYPDWLPRTVDECLERRDSGELLLLASVAYATPDPASDARPDRKRAAELRDAAIDRLAEGDGWQPLVAAALTGELHEGRPVEWTTIRDWPLAPARKRTVLVALGQARPDWREQAFTLATQLNFTPAVPQRMVFNATRARESRPAAGTRTAARD